MSEIMRCVFDRREPGEHTQPSIRMAYPLASVAFRRPLAVSGVAGVLC